jgi:hypothetical protein
VAARHRLKSVLRPLLNESLLLYLAAIAAHRIWLLLNSDVVQLVRRVH